MLLSARTLHHRSDIYNDFWMEQEYISPKMDFYKIAARKMRGLQPRIASPSRDEEIFNDDTEIKWGLNPQQMDIAINTKDIRND